MKKFFLLVLLVISALSVFAQKASLNISKREEIKEDLNSQLSISPEKTSPLQAKRSSIYVRTNVSNAKVFLNGIYQGTSNITISDLRDGFYNLKVEKEGYKTERFKIQVKDGVKQDYYVELKQWTGFVTFSVTPSWAEIKVDSDVIRSSTVELSEGSHWVQVRYFGYETLKEEIWVERRNHIYAEIVLTEAEYKVTGFEAGKKSFNPQLPDSMGKCKFEFYVTNDGACDISVADEGGSIVRKAHFSDFRTWNNSFAWDGCDENGNIVPDGIYTATLISGKDEFTAQVAVDSSIQFPFAFPGSDGLSIGSVGTALMNPPETLTVFANAGLDFTNKGKAFYGVPFYLGLDYAVNSWGSLAGYCGYFPKTGEDTFIAGCSLRLAGKIKCEGGSFNAAAIIKGCGNNIDLYEPCGFDNDRGLGIGAAFGWETKSLYAGIISEFVYNAIQDDDLYDMDCLWKNGGVIQFRGNHNAFGVYGIMCSVFGDKNYWNRSAEGGLDLTVQLGSHPAFFNIRSGILYFFETDNKMYSRTKAGIEYLF